MAAAAVAQLLLQPTRSLAALCTLSLVAQVAVFIAQQHNLQKQPHLASSNALMQPLTQCSPASPAALHCCCLLIHSYATRNLLQTAAGLFVDFTISRFEEVKQLHIILLVCTLVAVLLFVTKVFRPHVARLHAESKAMAGMMSQLPAEVDIEGHVKQHVLGLRRDGGASLRMGSMGEPGGAGNSSMIGGMGLGGMEAGRRSMPGMLLPPPPGGKMGGGVLALAGHYGGGGRGSGPGMAMGGMDGGGGQWEDDA